MNFLNPWELAKLEAVPGLTMHAPLRVYGGEPTNGQLRAAKDAHAVFCTAARVSMVPNPVQRGYLADGSPYVITAVGHNVVMQLWVNGAEDEAGYPPGVGISVLVPHESGQRRVLFVLSWLQQGLKVTKPDAFFGGDGLWAASKGKQCLMWQSERSKSPSYRASFRNPVQQPPKSIGGMTLGHGGAGYQIDPEISAESGRYAMVMDKRFVRWTDFKSSMTEVGAFSTAAADPEVYARTPFEPAAKVSSYLVEPVSFPQGLDLPDERERVVSQLRSGQQVVIALENYDYDFKLNLGVLSPRALTHEMRLKLSDGVPEVSFNEVFMPEWASMPEGSTFSSMEPSSWRCRLGSVLSAPDDVEYLYSQSEANRSVVAAIAVYCDLQAVMEFTKSVSVQALVYSGKGWKDEAVEFKLKVESSASYNQNSAGERFALVGTEVGIRNGVIMYGAGGSAAIGLTPYLKAESKSLIEDTPGFHYSGGQYPAALGAYPQPSRTAKGSAFGSFTRNGLRYLETPWGDVELSRSMVAAKFGQEGVEAFTAEYLRRKVAFVDRFLGVLVLGETRYADFTVRGSGESFEVSYSFSESVVVLVRGQESARFEVRRSSGTFSMSNPYMASVRGAFSDIKTSYGPSASIKGSFTSPWNMYAITESGLIPGGVVNEPWEWELGFSKGLEMQTGNYKPSDASYLNFGISEQEGYDASDVDAVSALDPGSGGGVFALWHGGNVRVSLAISPKGQVQQLNSVIKVPAGSTIEDVVSV